MLVNPPPHLSHALSSMYEMNAYMHEIKYKERQRIIVYHCMYNTCITLT